MRDCAVFLPNIRKARKHESVAQAILTILRDSAMSVTRSGFGDRAGRQGSVFSDCLVWFCCAVCEMAACTS